MISIDTVIKNQDLTNNKIDFENMNAEELSYYRRKYTSLQNNKILMNSLSDKGERVRKKLEFIESLISRPSIKNSKRASIVASDVIMDQITHKLTDVQLNSKDNVDKESTSEQAMAIDLDAKFQNLVDTFDDEALKDELMSELKSPENLDQIGFNIVGNYSRITNNRPSETRNKSFEKRTMHDLDEIKLRIVEKYKLKTDVKLAKTIPMDDSLKLLDEQTKHLQELQMQQAAQKLVDGKGLNAFDYSYGIVDHKTLKKKYRNTDGNHSDLSDDDENFKGEYSDDDGSESEDENFFNHKQNIQANS